MIAMGCLLVGVAISPRIVALILYFWTQWFSGVFETTLWPVLGWFFMPASMLWYSCVMNWYGGHWGFLQNFVMVISVLCDWGVISSGSEVKLNNGKNTTIKFR